MTSHPPSGPPTPGASDADTPRSQRRPLAFVIVLVTVLVVLLGLAVFLGVRTFQESRDDGDGDGPDRSAPESTPSPTPTPASTRGVVGFSVVEDSTPKPPDGCPKESAWKELDGTCLRLGGGTVAVVTARATTRAGEPIVALRLRAPADEAFAKLTGQHSGDQIAIVVGAQVASAPVVNGPITGGSVEITGNFTREDTERLVDEIGS